MKLHIYSIKAQKFLFLQIEVWSMRILISNWLTEYTWSMLWRRCLLNDHSGWQKLCEGMNGLRQKIWTRKKILSPNKRDMKICRDLRVLQSFHLSTLRRKTASFHTDSRRKTASFRPISDKRQLPFFKTQTLSSRFRHKTFPFVHTWQVPSSRLTRKTASFRPDSDLILKT